MSLVLGAVVFFIAHRLTRALCSPSSPLCIVDRPNSRSLHTQPTPRTGGVAILGGLLTGLVAAHLVALTGPARWTAMGDPAVLVILAMAALLGAVSFWDDTRGLRIAARLAVQASAASVVVVAGGLSIRSATVPGVGSLDLGAAGPAVSIVLLMWMANLYNFMDGMDGFAGGMTVAGFGFLALIGAQAGHETLATLSTLIAAASAGFLVHNLPPARIFMGDTGSVSLGFLAAALILLGVRDGIFDVWVPLLIFSPFVVDATVTLLRRLGRLEKFWRPHREHYYQRLVLAGWGHRKTLIAEYGLMVACGATACIYWRARDHGQLLLLIAWAVVYALLVLGIHAVQGKNTESRQCE